MRKLFAIPISVVMLLAIGATGSAELTLDTVLRPTAEDYPIDLSEHKTISIVLCGDTPEDFDMVLEYVNEYLTAEFNTTIEFTMVSWSDRGTVYPLMLTGGDKLDLVYDQAGFQLFQSAATGYWYPLTEEFLSTYMPYSWQYQSDVSWQQVTYNGQIIGVPQGIADAGGATNLIAVRNDIMEKYGVTVIDTFEDLRQLWLAIAADTEETGLMAFNEEQVGGYAMNFYNQDKMSFTAGNTNNFNAIWNDGAVPAPEDIFYYYDSDHYAAGIHVMKELADAGVWSRSALSNHTSNYVAYSVGASATGAFNGSIYWYANQLRDATGLESTVFCLGRESGTPLVMCENYNQNTICIFVDCEDKPRAAMILDVLKYDTEMNHALIGGLRDYHYTEPEPGVYEASENAGGWQFNSFGIDWNIKNGSFMAVYTEPGRMDMHVWMQEVGSYNPCAAFVFDSEPVTAYKASVEAVVEEYRYALNLGLVEDIDATYAEFQSKLDEAGLQEYFDEYIRQYTEWYNAL